MFIYESHGDYKIREKWCGFLDVDLIVTSSLPFSLFLCALTLFSHLSSHSILFLFFSDEENEVVWLDGFKGN